MCAQFIISLLRARSRRVKAKGIKKQAKDIKEKIKHQRQLSLSLLLSLSLDVNGS